MLVVSTQNTLLRNKRFLKPIPSQTGLSGPPTPWTDGHSAVSCTQAREQPNESVATPVRGVEHTERESLVREAANTTKPGVDI